MTENQIFGRNLFFTFCTAPPETRWMDLGPTRKHAATLHPPQRHQSRTPHTYKAAARSFAVPAFGTPFWYGPSSTKQWPALLAGRPHAKPAEGVNGTNGSYQWVRRPPPQNVGPIGPANRSQNGPKTMCPIGRPIGRPNGPECGDSY
jgi:hypothetical protein